MEELINKNLLMYKQILPTNTIRNVWTAVRRMWILMLGLKEFISMRSQKLRDSKPNWLQRWHYGKGQYMWDIHNSLFVRPVLPCIQTFREWSDEGLWWRILVIVVK